MALYPSSLPTNTPSATDVNNVLHICSVTAVKWPQGDPLITSDRSAVAGVCWGCNFRISKGGSFLYLAECCTVLRSRWYLSGIHIPLISVV
jgi:hypothetical protein